MAEGSAGCEAEPRGPAGLGRSARGPGVCRVFAGRRHMARAPVMWAGPRRPKIVLSAGAMGHAPPVRPAGRRLADSHLASPTAMHAVGPPPFPRRPEVTSVRPAQARGLSRRGRPPWSRGARAGYSRAMTQAWDKTLRARGYSVTPQRQLVLAAVTKLEHATPEEIWAAVQQTASGVNISTIYPALELLEQLGLVTHTHLGHGPPSSHLAAEAEHVHLLCPAC